MSGYINTLVVTMVVSQITVQLAPAGTDSKKYVKFICGLVVFICMFSPITTALNNSSELFDIVKDMFKGTEQTETPNLKYAQESATIMTYITENYKVDRNSVRTTIITNSDDTEIIEVHVFISGCETIVADKIESVLEKELEIPVYVFNTED